MPLAIAYELKTPLSAILASSEILNNTGLDNSGQLFCKISARHLINWNNTLMSL